MPQPLSKALGLTHEALDSAGVFDGFLDVDSRLYVDPHLLAASNIPELAGSYQRFTTHFGGILAILKAAPGKPPAFRRTAVNRLTFREIPVAGLGYGKETTAGSGIGQGLAEQLAALAEAIVAAGIEDPQIFELVGLLQEGIGADRISDMTIYVVLPDILAYTSRIAKQLKVAVKATEIRDAEYELPVTDAGKAVIFIPKVILRDLPVAESWEDIDVVASKNAVLRDRVNNTIGSTWRHATRRISKAELRQTLLKNPELIKDLLQQYAAKPTDAYDFVADPAAQQLWFYLSQAEAEKSPLDLKALAAPTKHNIVAVVAAICNKFKDLVEDNRLYRLLYNDDGARRHERIAQLGFFAVADSYCEANDLDLSPEPNSGPGPVDFKVSAGYKERVTVEIKLSSNPDLAHGYEVQLPLYNNAEKARESFFVIVRVDENLTRLKKVQDLRAAAIAKGMRAPEVLVIDGRAKPSASKA